MGRFQAILFAKIEAQRRETDGTVQRIVLVDGRKAALCAISLWSRWQYPGGRRSPGGLKQPSLGLGQAAQGRHTGESL